MPLQLVGNTSSSSSGYLLLVAALLQLLPCTDRALTVGDEADLGETVDEHLRGVELRAHAELGRGVVERVLVVPAWGGGGDETRKKSLLPQQGPYNVLSRVAEKRTPTKALHKKKRKYKYISRVSAKKQGVHEGNHVV